MNHEDQWNEKTNQSYDRIELDLIPQDGHEIEDTLLSRIKSGQLDNGGEDHAYMHLESVELMEVEGLGRRAKYDDFTTIDWIHDSAKERIRRRHLQDAGGMKGCWLRIWDAAQSWIVVFMIGVSIGWIAAALSISTEWLSDMKLGFCTKGFWLNKKFCCWGEAVESCSDWVFWHRLFSMEYSWLDYILGYIAYGVLGVAMAGMSAILVQAFSPYASGSGIAEVKTILSGFIIKGFLGVKTLLIKSVGLILSVASGLSLGKEGPMVHIACCCGNIFPKVFSKFSQNEAKKREILSAAAAAGVSVAFGAPIGGVLFSLEEVSYYFPSKTMFRSFFCAMVAAVSLQLMNPFRTGRLVIYQVTYHRDWHSFELLPFVLLGIFGGLFGVLFIRLSTKIAMYRKTSGLSDWQIQDVMIVAFITALINYVVVYLRVDTSELLEMLFNECEKSSFFGLCDRSRYSSIASLLFVACLLKIMTTILAFGIKVPAGIYIPSMGIGACFGRVIGMMVQSIQEAYPDFGLFVSCKTDSLQCVTPGLYAMVGAASFLGGVTRMTVSLVVIMFELTGALTYVLPVMLAVMISKWVGDAFGHDGIYDQHIRLNGYPYLSGTTELAYGIQAQHAMTRVDFGLCVLTSCCNTIEALETLLNTTNYNGFPIVDSIENMNVIGYIARSDLKYALVFARNESQVNNETVCHFDAHTEFEHSSNYADLHSWVDHTPFQISEQFSLGLIIELFRKMGLRYVLVTKNGRLAGVITKKDLIRHQKGVMQEVEIPFRYEN